MLKPLVVSLVERGAINAPDLRAGVEALLRGEYDEAEAAAFLTALRLRGESAEHLAAAASILREQMVRLDTGGLQVLDTCGTGGDGAGTFNISTAVAIVVAGCGVPVVKHGNRGVSSVCGSADVMEALGVRLDAGPAAIARCLQEVGLAFCFAPIFHPAMRRVAELRRRLGFRTIFNLLGPLVNPAQPAFQLIGVAQVDLLDRLASALAQLGGTTAYLVHGQDGLDEVTLGAPTTVRLVDRGQVAALEWTPEMFNFPRHAIRELRVESAAESAALLRRILAGERGAAGDFVLANSSAALYSAQRVASLPEGVQRAREAILAGAAQKTLDRLVDFTQHVSAKERLAI
jgi:anthranilate phosphoribosyltransferase